MYFGPRSNGTRGPKYDRSASYPVNVRLSGETMLMLDSLMERTQYDSYDDLIESMVEHAHDMW